MQLCPIEKSLLGIADGWPEVGLGRWLDVEVIYGK